MLFTLLFVAVVRAQDTSPARTSVHIKCGINEKYYEVLPCPPLNCDISYTSYSCDNVPRESGCDCKENYLRAPNGTCIYNECCPPPNQCGVNEIYVQCNAKCPNEYCATEDNAMAVCDPPKDCPPGCACKPGYLRRSIDDDTCIPSKSCPQVKCSKPNEVWNPCGSYCKNESCDAREEDADGVACAAVCVPRCECETGHCRNKHEVCVRSKKCNPTKLEN